MLFFHVGMHKTGTTFLQQAVFPHWRGINYVQWPHLEILLRLDDNKINLVSREGLSGKNWAHYEERERSLQRLAELFPASRILISFRKHSGYILSSYRQYIQRGGTVPFDAYFDLDRDSGVMKREDFIFRRKLTAIEKYFRHRPFAFLHEEITKDFPTLLRDMEGYIGGKAPDPTEISNRRYNESIGYYPALLLRRINSVSRSELNPEGKYNLNHPTLQRLQLTPALICQKWLSILPSRAFLEPEKMARIDEFFRDDWEYVRSYAAERTKNAGHPVEPD
jgi:hypothetical protein